MNKLIIYGLCFLGLLVAAPLALAQDQLELMNMADGTNPAGATVGIIDTTFNPSSFSNTTVVGSTSTGYIDHGTLMNGAISDPFWGTAPNTAVIGYSCQSGSGVDLICAQNALQTMVNENKVKVISLSFSYPGAVPQSIYNQWATIAAQANAKGIMILASSGNALHAGFPASVDNILSVGTVDKGGNPTGTNEVDLRAPGQGIVTLLSCDCDAAATGVSYSTAWAAGLAARYFAEGKDFTDVKNIITADNSKSILAPTRMRPTTIYTLPRPVQPVKTLTHGRAVYRHGRVVITWRSTRSVFYKVQVGQRRAFTRRKRASFRAYRAPKFVYVRSGKEMMKLRVRVARR